MPLSKLPVTNLDDINHRRRARETINQVLDHSFDDSRVQTKAEKLAGVTPINKAYPPGDVRRYGAKGDGVTDDTDAIRAAILAAGVGTYRGIVYIPAGAYLVSETLLIGTADNSAKPIWIYGDGDATQIINGASSSKPTFKFSGVYHWRLSDMMLLGNSAHLNDGVVVNASGTGGIRWNMERITSLMAGRGIVLQDTNTGVIRDFKHWPDSIDNALIIPQSVTMTDVDHGIYLTGSFVHDISIYDADCFPRDTFKANAAGIRCDATGPNSGNRVFGSVVQGNAGNGRFGIYIENWTSGFIHGTYHESSKIRLRGCTSVSVIATNTGGVEGVFSLDTNCSGNVISNCTAASLSVDDSSCSGNVFIGCNFSAITDAAKPNNTYLYSRGGTGFTGPKRGGTPWTTVTYSASMTPSCDVGNLFNIVPNNGTAFTVNAPSNPMDGDQVTIKIRNATGGALGVLTWDAQIKSANATQPANGFSTIRVFTHDKSYGSGVLWIQTGADVTVAN